MAEELKVIQKAYDLCVYLVPMVNRFPRDFKFTLGDRITNAAVDVLEDLIAARYTRDRAEILRRTNLRIERLRHLLRLSGDFGILGGSSVEHSAKSLDEVGRLVGGWLKAAT
jgi:hypothetical protein